MKISKPQPITGRTWTPVTATNAGLAFALELGLLAALCYWGFSTGPGLVVKCLLGLGAPALAAVLWGLFLAAGGPRFPVPVGVQIVLKLVLFGLAGWALAGTGHTVLGLVFGALAVLSIGVEYVN